MRILVTGATGTIGSAVCEALLEAGHKVFAGSRNTDKDSRKLPAAAGVRTFDFDRPDSWEEALEEMEGLYLVAAISDPAPVFSFLDLVDKTHSLDYIVFSSGRTTGSIPGKPLHQIEERLKAGDTPFTIIRPGWFMQNFLAWLGPDIRDHDRIALPAGDAATTFVDVRDLAEGACRLFGQPAAHLSHTYEWVGQESLTHAEVAHLFSKALGRKIRYEALTDEAYIGQLIQNGTPPDKARATDFLYQIVRQGHEASPVDDLPDLLGKDTRRFRAFIRDHLDFWKKTTDT